MTIELRLASLYRLDVVLGTSAGAVGIGQEGCVHKLPSEDDMLAAADRVRASGREVTVVLPIAWERSSDRLLGLALRLASAGAVTLVVNDLGLLGALSDSALPAATRVAIGHGMSFGYAQSPWHGLWAEREDASLREPLLAANWTDPSSLALLRTLSVSAVEMDAVTASNTPLSAYHDAGLAVRVMARAVPVGFARACPTARHYGLGPPSCVDACEAPFGLAPAQRWRLADGYREAMEPQARALAGGLTVFGNAVYRETDQAPPAGADDIVIDCRWYSDDELRAHVEAMAG